MNRSEHATFVASLQDVMTGKVTVDKLLSSRRRGRRKPPKVVVQARVDFDRQRLLEQHAPPGGRAGCPGLLRAISLAIAARGCNIEVALVDTEGETAIDVFYVTRRGFKLDELQRPELREDLLRAMEANAS